jgi:hypothetical protein
MPAILCRLARGRLALVALSLLLPAAPLPAAPLPAAVDLRPRFQEWGLTVKDQGRRGTCVLHAMAGVLEYEHAAAGARGLRLSEEYLVWAAREATGHKTEDSSFPGVLSALSRHGACRAELMPYAARFDPSAVPSAKARADGLNRRLVVADWAVGFPAPPSLTAAHLRRMKERLAAGHPLAAAFRWPVKLAFSAGHTMQVPPPGGVGGIHAVMLVGYQDDASQPGGGVFLLRNSWGPKWGDGGYARLPYAYAAAYGADSLSLRVGPEATNRTAGALHKAEDLPVVWTADCSAGKQDMARWGKGLWNRDRQLFCNAGKGGVVVLRLRVPHSGAYQVDFYGTRAPDYGRLRVTLDGKPLGAALDGYAVTVIPTGRVRLGERRLEAGDHLLRFEVVGKAGESRGYKFGVDGIDLVPVGR